MSIPKISITIPLFLKLTTFTAVCIFYLGCIALIFRFQVETVLAQEIQTNEFNAAKFSENTLPLNTSIQVPILMYHYVEYVQDKKDTLRQSLNINPDIFEQQMITLKNDGYTFMQSWELGEVLDGKRKLPAKPIIITIDDGHWDVDTVILPILKKYNIKATVYIIPGLLGGSDFLTEQQVKNLLDSGLIEIGDHTVNHISLKGKDLQTVHYEIFQSKQMLEQTYHIKIKSFAYPSGFFDLQAIDEVKKAKFTTAVSTMPGLEVNQSNKFILFRLRPGHRMGQSLLNFIVSPTH